MCKSIIIFISMAAAAMAATAQPLDEAALLAEDSGSAALSAAMGPGERSRADVRAEVLAARDSGELAAMVGEDSGAAWLVQQPADDGALRHAAPRDAAGSSSAG